MKAITKDMIIVDIINLDADLIAILIFVGITVIFLAACLIMFFYKKNKYKNVQDWLYYSHCWVKFIVKCFVSGNFYIYSPQVWYARFFLLVRGEGITSYITLFVKKSYFWGYFRKMRLIFATFYTKKVF